jgi:hypothetical protein
VPRFEAVEGKIYSLEPRVHTIETAAKNSWTFGGMVWTAIGPGVGALVVFLLMVYFKAQ